jgi:hypothetical protein
MLSIMFEYAACLLVALIGGTFLFTISAMFVMLSSAFGITWRWWRELASRSKWLLGRWIMEPRVETAPDRHFAS